MFDIYSGGTTKKSETLLLCHAGTKEERRYSSYSFLTSAVDGVSGQHHNLAAIYALERTPDTHCTGGWVGLRTSLDTHRYIQKVGSTGFKFWLRH
jgi:hypothetical protein